MMQLDYKSLYDQFPEAIVISDPRTGRILDCNNAAERLTGRSKDEIVGSPHYKLYPKNQANNYRAKFKSFIKGSGTANYEAEIANMHGSNIPVAINTSLASMDGSDVLVQTFTHLTEHDHLSDKQRQEDTVLRAAFDNVNDEVIVLDTAGIIINVNKKCQDTSGYGTDELIGHSFLEVEMFDSDELSRITSLLSASGSQGPVARSPMKTQIRHKDGHAVPVELSSIPISSSEGKLEGFICVLRDVTERKRAREAMIRSERILGELVEGLDEVIYRMSLPDGNYQYCSPGAIAVFGYSSEEFLANPLLIREIMHPDSALNFKKKWAELMQGKVPPIYEYKVVDPEGHVRWIVQSNEGIVDNAGNIVGIEGICRDVTESKLASRALEESESRWRCLAENTPSFISIINRDGRILSINHALPGLTIDEVIGSSIYKYVSPDYRDLLRTQIKSVFKEKQAVRFETRGVSVGSDLTWYENHLGPVIKKGRVESAILISDDITNRKQAENLAHTQYELSLWLCDAHTLAETLCACLESAIQVSGMDCGGIYLVDEISGDLDMAFSKELPSDFVKTASHYDSNSATARVVIAGKPIYTRYQEPGVRSSRAKNSENLRAIAIIPVHYNDKVIAFMNIASLTLDEVPASSRIALETIASQIGHAIIHSKTGQALRQSEEKYRDLVENINDVVFSTDAQGIITYTSPHVSRYGFHPEDIISKNILDIVAPEDRSKVLESFTTSSVFGEMPTTILRIPDGNGHLNWFENVGSARYDETGELIGFNGVLRDVTDRKRAEGTLHKSQKQMEATLNAIPDLLLEVDTEGCIHNVHSSTPGLLHFPPEELINRRMSDVLPEKSSAIIMKAIDEANQIGHCTGATYFMETPNGTRWFELSIAAQEHPNTLNSHLIALARDITDRKHVENELKESQVKYSTVVEQAADAIIIGQDYAIKFANTRAAELTGYKMEELIGMGFTRLLPPESVETIRDRYELRIAGEELPNFYDVDLLDKDGNRLPVEVNAGVIEYDGRPADLVFLRDITEHKQAEEDKQRLLQALEEQNDILICSHLELEQALDYAKRGQEALHQQEQFFRTLIENSTDGIILIDRDGHITYQSPAYQTITGRNIQDRIGAPALDPEFIHPDDMPQVIDRVSRLFQGLEANSTMELRMMHTDGSWHWLEAMAANHMDNPAVEGIVASFRDITKRKQIEEELQIAHRDLMERSPKNNLGG